jgi:hypothetical protein
MEFILLQMEINIKDYENRTCKKEKVDINSLIQGIMQLGEGTKYEI